MFLWYFGLNSKITHDRVEVLEARAAILPGVGAFGPAMRHLDDLGLIPVINENRVVVDYVTMSNIEGENQSKKILAHVPVVIMAGGKGTRMEPFTKILPKPLVPIQEKPIIEHIIECFTNLG